MPSLALASPIEGWARDDSYGRTGREQAQAMEPQLECVAALHSPSTGIFDSHAMKLSLQGDIENTAGCILINTAVAQIIPVQSAIEVIALDGTELSANSVINAAGLNAPGVVSRIVCLDSKHVPPTFWAKGNYFTLGSKSPFSRLIYPVPEAVGLGLHLMIDLGGQARFRPDVEWVDSPDDLAADPSRGDAFYAEVRKYWPGLKDGALQVD